MPSTEQLAQGGPDSVTVHRTLRELQALHATEARLATRFGGISDENIPRGIVFLSTIDMQKLSGMVMSCQSSLLTLAARQMGEKSPRLYTNPKTQSACEFRLATEGPAEVRIRTSYAPTHQITLHQDSKYIINHFGNKDQNLATLSMTEYKSLPYFINFFKILFIKENIIYLLKKKKNSDKFLMVRTKKQRH